MPAYVIQYDLTHADGHDYKTLIEKLEGCKAVRATKSTWFLSTSWEVIRLRDYFRAFMHKKDVISVNVLSVGQGFASENLPHAAVVWMNEHLKVKQAVGK